MPGLLKPMMDNENKTRDPLIYLLGINIHLSFKIPIILLICLLYILTLLGNLTIFSLVHASQNLKQPMFFFLGHLSLCDIVLTTNIVPNMLHVIQCGGITITFAACMIQFMLFSIAVATECLLLAVMSYDRYLAICNPLRYTSIMNNQLRLWLAISCWFLSITFSLVAVIMIKQLDFCRQNIIDHFFCDYLPILQLSCSDTSALQIEQAIFGTPITVIPVGFICLTYIHIFITILRISSSSGRQKAFSTCSSHLTVVGAYFGSLISIYVIPSSANDLNANKLSSLFYVVITPLLNPIIYSLRNTEIRVALEKEKSKIKIKLKNVNCFNKNF